MNPNHFPVGVPNNQYPFLAHSSVAVDFLPLVIAVFVIGAILKAFYSFFLYRKVKVQCWFCHITSQVDRSATNSWYCRSCEQYNGFTEDGDYNKHLPEQWDGTYNHASKALRRAMIPRRTILCSICTHNQALKLQHISTFTPMSEATLEEDANRFLRRVEVAYRLCSMCEVAVQHELEYQRKQSLYSSIRPMRPHDVDLPVQGTTVSDWMSVFLRGTPIFIALTYLLGQFPLLEIALISIWLLVYIIVFIYYPPPHGATFTPPLMILGLIVNIIGETKTHEIPGVHYVIYWMRNLIIHTILYILVALPSYKLFIPSQVVQKPVKPTTVNPFTSTFTNPFVSNNNHVSNSTISPKRTGRAQNPFGPTPTRFQPENRTTNNNNFGRNEDIFGGMSLDSMLSRVEISEKPQEDKKEVGFDKQKKYVIIFGFCVAIFGCLVYILTGR